MNIKWNNYVTPWNNKRRTSQTLSYKCTSVLNTLIVLRFPWKYCQKVTIRLPHVGVTVWFPTLYAECSTLPCRLSVVLALFILQLNAPRFSLFHCYSPACSRYSDIWSRNLLLSDDCSSSISEVSKSSACSCFFLADAISAACFFLHFVRLFWNHTYNNNSSLFKKWEYVS